MAARGFKSWCERVSQDFRLRLGLKPIDPLAPRSLAKHLNVKVLAPSDIKSFNPSELHQLVVADTSAWSAVTLVRGKQKVVILNSAHSPSRQSNDLMHELGHIICGHKATLATVNEDGLLIVQDYNAAQEEEADLLSATLLLPRLALVQIMEAKWKLDEAAAHYHVSKALLEMRLRRAGVYTQFERRQKLWGR